MDLAVVFGGTGYLGRCVVHGLQASGWRVRSVSRRGDEEGAAPEISSIRADILDSDGVMRAIDGAALVVNAVSLYVPSARASYDAVHVGGARGLARACRRAGVRSLIHLSGIGADAGSRSVYISARGKGEIAVRDACPAATILRPSVLFGAGGGVLEMLDAISLAAPVIPLIGGGTTRLQPVHVEDVAAAVVHAGEGRMRGTTCELGGNEIVTLRHLAERVLEATDRRCLLLPVSFALARTAARACSFLPRPPLTLAQVELLENDNVASPDFPGLAALGIAPRSLAAEIAALGSGRTGR